MSLKKNVNLAREMMNLDETIMIVTRPKKGYFFTYNSQQGPSDARVKFNSFFVKQSFFSRDLFRFWGTPGSGSS